MALGNRDREARRHERPLARCELDALAGRRSSPASPEYARDGQHRLLANPPDGKLDHALSRCVGLGDQVRREAAKLVARQSRDDQHAVGRVLALVDRSAERVQLGEPAALLVGQKQPHGLEPAGEALRDPRLQLLEPLPRRRRDLKRAGEPILEPPAADLVDTVDLVQHELDRQVRGADLVEHVLDRGDHRIELVLGGRGIGDMEHKVGDERLLERRREAFDELVRQAADEADGIGHEVAAPVVLEAARGRIERLEQPVLDRDRRRR